MSSRGLMALGVSIASLVTGCGAIAESATSMTEQEISDPSVSPDQGVYAAGAPITVAFAGLSGSTTDWVAIAKPSDPESTWSAWAYTGGGTDGSVVMPTARLAAGTYELRAYNDWQGTQSLTAVAHSDSFTVGLESGAVVVNGTSFQVGDPITVTYTGLPGTPTDWIGFAPPGSAPEVFGGWAYTDGSPDGSVTVTDLGPGTWVARSYAEDGFVVTGVSEPFTVGLVGATVATSQASYAPTDSITVTFTGLSTSPVNWITVVPTGAAPEVYNEWHYTQGAVSGDMTFAPLQPGDYEVRVFLTNGFTRVATTTFSVASTSPSVMPAATEYDAGASVSVTWGGLSGAPRDWIAVSPAGSPAETYTAWVYTQGHRTGSYTFTGLPVGAYEVRAYADDSFTILSTAAFRIYGPLATSADTYTTGDTVDVRYSGLAGNPRDWIGVAPAGSADDVTTAWFYTGGHTGGHVQFTGLAAGDYEARSYLDDSYTVEQRVAFSVVDPAP